MERREYSEGNDGIGEPAGKALPATRKEWIITEDQWRDHENVQET